MAENGTQPLTARDVLDALQKHHAAAALVPEVVIQNHAYELGDTFTRRIDALMFDSLQRTAVEIKVSVADANRETWHKVEPWVRVTHRFVYAVPAGLIDKPPAYWGAGLWWVHDDGRVEVRKRAKINAHPEPLPQLVIQSLAYRAAKAARP